MENLKLSFVKPLVFIKVQTTGLNPAQDRVIELSLTKVEIEGKPKNGTRYVNPEMEIPEVVTKINGITNEMVKDKPTFKEIAPNILKFLDGCDFVGFNISNFDLKFLSEEFNRAGIEFTLLGRKIIDLANVYHAMEPRDLTAAYSFYCGKTSDEKVNSKQTTEIYFDILNSMMDKYSGKNYSDKEGNSHKIESTVDSINNLFNKNKKQLDLDGLIVMGESNRPIFAKGKYGPKDGRSGQIVAEALLKDREYFDWLVNASAFAPDTKLVLKKIFAKAESVSMAK